MHRRLLTAVIAFALLLPLPAGAFGGWLQQGSGLVEVVGSSMEGTLHDGSEYPLERTAYLRADPRRGDIIVFEALSDPGTLYLKRVIGLPGETVTIRGGAVYVSRSGRERRLAEPYLSQKSRGKTYASPPDSGDTSRVVFAVPEGEYFVLGDNRRNSLDSRSFAEFGGSPFIPLTAIQGRVDPGTRAVAAPARRPVTRRH